MLRQSTDGQTGDASERTLQETTVLTLWRLLNEEDRVVVQSVLEDKHRLRDLELKLAQMSAALAELKHSG